MLAPRRAHPHYRTLFLSDTHLYSEGCRYDVLGRFLKHKHFETIYLVGDIVDLWRLNARRLKVHAPVGTDHWHVSHAEVETAEPLEQGDEEKSITIIRRLLKRGQHDHTKIIYVPGNHDDFFRNFIGLEMFGVRLESEAVHTTADGRRLLVLHGDRFDTVVRYHRWLAVCSAMFYDWGVWLNKGFDRVRGLIGLSHWSLAKSIKSRVDGALGQLDDFETEVLKAARAHGLDGAVCGHSHQPCVKEVDGMTFANCGDWVENATAVVERADGSLALLSADTDTVVELPVTGSAVEPSLTPDPRPESRPEPTPAPAPPSPSPTPLPVPA